MTFKTLFNSVVDGQLNYYSRPFNIIIEPLNSQALTDYKLTVQQKHTIVEDVDIYFKPQNNPQDADDLRNRILLEKQKLHAKYILL